MPKIIKLRLFDDDEDPSSLIKPSTSEHTEVASKEEKKKNMRKFSGSLDAELKKKRVTIRARESKKSTKYRAPDSDSLYRFRDYPKDDDLELVAHESTLNKGEQAATGKGDHEADPSLARVQEGETEVAASREAACVPKEVAGVIDIMEASSYTESMLEEAQADIEKSNEMALGQDDSLITFFDGMEG